MYEDQSVKHVLITDGFITEDKLLMVGEGLFQFNVRGHGDFKDDLVWIQGKFWQRDGEIVFRARDPNGNYTIYESDEHRDLALRVTAYLKFLD